MISGGNSAPLGEGGLTNRERQVLIFLSDGATSAQIGHAMGISATTVDKYIAAIRRALGTRNRTELVTLALREGMGSSEPQGRPIALEVEFGPRGEVLETTVRYVPGDAARAAPIFLNVLDIPFSSWADALMTETEGLSRGLSLARDTDEWVAVDGASVMLPGSEEPYVWSGAVQRLGSSHFVLRIATPYPGEDQL